MNKTLDIGFEFFLKNDFEDFKEGEWIAIFGNKIVSHGTVLKEVVKEAQKTTPLSKVLLTKVKKSASYL